MSSSRPTAGRVEFHSVTLRAYITTAYRVRDYQISAPAWLKEQEWDIVAKLPDGAPSSQMPEMLQTLLAERFKLQVHREKREFPGLALVVGSSGPKLRKSDEAPARRGMTGVRMSTGPAGGRLIAPRATMAMLASFISTLLGRPVADETQVSGTYNVELEYGPEMTGPAAPMMAGPDTGAATAQAAGGPRPSIFTSLKNLGLKLESRKVLMEVIVVDHAEKSPTEN